MTRYPFPAVPNGWFSVATSDGLGAGAVRRVAALNREIVAFRGEDGVVRRSENWDTAAYARNAAVDITHPETGDVIVAAGHHSSVSPGPGALTRCSGVGPPSCASASR